MDDRSKHNRVALPAVNSLFSHGDTSISFNFNQFQCLCSPHKSKMDAMGNKIHLWIQKRVLFQRRCRRTLLDGGSTLVASLMEEALKGKFANGCTVSS